MFLRCLCRVCCDYLNLCVSGAAAFTVYVIEGRGVAPDEFVNGICRMKDMRMEMKLDESGRPVVGADGKPLEEEGTQVDLPMEGLVAKLAETSISCR